MEGGCWGEERGGGRVRGERDGLEGTGEGREGWREGAGEGRECRVGGEVCGNRQECVVYCNVLCCGCI